MLLNWLEIELNKDNVQLFVGPYDHSRFKNLIDSHDDIYFFKHSNSIYAWPLNPNANSPEIEDFDRETISLKENPRIAEKILSSCISSFLKARDNIVYQNKYSNIWTLHLKKPAPQSFEGLNYIPILNFSIQTLSSERDQNLYFGITLDVTTKPRFIFSKNEFSKRHIDTTGWDIKDDRVLATRRNIKSFSQVTNQENKISSFIQSNDNPNRLLSEFEKFSQYFNSSKDEIFLPDSLCIDAFHLRRIPNFISQIQNIKKPIYYYYLERTKFGYYDKVMEELRPYSYDAFKNKMVNIKVVTPDVWEGTVDSFVFKITNNLKNLFHLEKLNLTVHTFNKLESNYIDKINSLDLDNCDLVIAVLSEDDKKIPIEKSPYFLTKAKLLNQKIPTQKVTIEKLKQLNIHILKSLAINIYCKLGGVPWAIEKKEKNKTELIIGISTSVDELGNRLIGFANIFDFNGNYISGDCSPISDKGKYASDLSSLLNSSLSHLVEGKQENEVRIVFHLTKSASKKYEIKAIEDAIKSFSDINIQFSILHLSPGEHNYRILSKNRDEVKRGIYIQLSPFSALLQIGDISSSPLLLWLDRRSTYKDLYDLTRQVMFFSHLSHTNFKPSNLPITITYPQKISKQTGRLALIPNWDVEMLSKLKDRLWFI